MWLPCRFGHIGSRPCPQLDWEVLQAGLKLPQDPHPNLQIPDAGMGRGPRVGFGGAVLQSQGAGALPLRSSRPWGAVVVSKSVRRMGTSNRDHEVALESWRDGSPATAFALTITPPPVGALHRGPRRGDSSGCHPRVLPVSRPFQPLLREAWTDREPSVPEVVRIPPAQCGHGYPLRGDIFEA